MYCLVLLVDRERIEVIRTNNNKGHLLRDWVSCVPSDTLRYMLKTAHQLLPIGGNLDLHLTDNIPLLLKQWKLVPVSIQHMIQDEMVVEDGNIQSASEHRLVILDMS